MPIRSPEDGRRLGSIPKSPRDPADSCGATKKRTPGTCTNPKGFRTDHPGAGNCYLHGGMTPSGKTHARREAATAALAALGQPHGRGDPFELLRDAVRLAHGQLLAAAKLVHDAVDAVRTGESPTIQLDEALRLLDRSVRTAGLTGKETVDADVADREVAIAQYQAEQMVALFKRALDKANIPPALRAAANTALVAELRDIPDGPVH